MRGQDGRMREKRKNETKTKKKVQLNTAPLER
jgi:hypothetical protein